MVNMLASIFTSIGSQQSSNVSRHLPMLNQIITSLNTSMFGVNQIKRKKELMAWYNRIPELTGLATKVARDVVHKWHFESVNPDDTNRNKMMKANRFSLEVELRKIMLAQIIDQLITGEAFGWKGKLTEKQVQAKLKEVLDRNYNIEGKEKSGLNKLILTEMKGEEGLADVNGISEDVLSPRKYRSIASSTMEIIYDQWEVSNYTQRVAGREEQFSTQEIIHYTMMDVDGKVSGFTPVESIIIQLELLRQMWQNNLSLHMNGGSPDKLFIAKDTRLSDPAFQRLEQQLMKYKLAENKHGNLLLNGDISVESLDQMDTMQFSDLGTYITGLIALQWQIPKSSIPYIFKATNTKDDGGGNSERGYWRNIEFMQESFAETMNTQLWIPHFGVRIIFDNTFVQHDVQVQTAQQLKLNNMKMVNELLGIHEMQLSKTKTLRKLGLSDNDIEKKPEEQIEVMGVGMNNQLGRDQANDGQDQTDKRAGKREEQLASATSRGMSPTGAGKETLKEQGMKLFESKEDSVMLDIDKFIKIFNEDKQYNPAPPRIFQKTEQEETIFFFKSTDFTYKTIIPNEELFNNKIRLMNLGNKIIKI